MTFGKFLLAVMFGLILATLIAMPLIYFTGWHHEIARGEHTGYVTAVVNRGIFFKTMRAYVKTDTQSSQEDAYCVVDPAIYDQLQQYSNTSTHVNLYFFQWLSAGIANCDDEGDVIYKVVPLTTN